MASLARLLSELRSSSPSEQERAADEICELADSPDGARLVAEVIPALLSVLQTQTWAERLGAPGADRARVVAAAAEALQKIATHQPRLVADAPGALPALVAALEAATRRGPEGPAEFALSAVTVRMCLLDTEHTRRFAAVPRALPALMPILLRGDGSAAVNAAAAVMSIAGSTPELAARVAETEGALPAFCALLSSPQPSAVCNAASGLAKIASASAELARRVGNNALRPLIAVLAHDYDRAAANAAAAIGTIARADSEHARMAAVAGALPLLRGLVQRCGVEGEPAMNATMAIGGIAAANGENAGRVSTDPAMLRALGPGALRSSNPETVASAAWALASVACQGGEHARRVAELPGLVPLLLAALRLPVDDAVVNAAAILSYISRDHADTVARAPGAVPALAALLDGRCARAVGPAVQALATLSGAGQTAAIAEAGGALTRLLALVNGGGGAAALQASIILFDAATRAGPASLRLLNTPGALEALVSALGPAIATSEFDIAANVSQSLAVLVQLDASVAPRIMPLPALLPALAAALACSNARVAWNGTMLAGAMAFADTACARRLAEEQSVVAGLAAAVVDPKHTMPGAAGNALTALMHLACAGPEAAARTAAAEGVVPALATTLRDRAAPADHRQKAAALLHTFLTTSRELALQVCDAPGGALHALAIAAAEEDGPLHVIAQVVLVEVAERGGAAAVAAALSGLLPPAAEGGPAAAEVAADLLAQPPLAMPATAIAALARAGGAAARLQARRAALEALLAAAPAEAAARPKVCAACHKQAGAGVKLRPCGDCQQDSPVGRTLYCGSACQKKDWHRHRAFCRAVKAARATACG
ncbi:hypothetical protein Rsub_09163 [Raphidocelis subcapitata]|uniref:MYND-type domain-containing protein n=1 Tax=Raphidocelis subcapitata TaxID=307507 RepID=A0A2V0PFB7_9CHLO|nr:hypothetical protein Rsub_09163 [Raphidocelis subcapitata]|eukprot:GBF96580.1 hypothetical protein Rsub_09163 [Raphidocelis subcapitata]